MARGKHDPSMLPSVGDERAAVTLRQRPLRHDVTLRTRPWRGACHRLSRYGSKFGNANVQPCRRATQSQIARKGPPNERSPCSTGRQVIFASPACVLPLRHAR
jgi:hypothetical protein